MADLSLLEQYDNQGVYQGLGFSIINGQIQFCNRLEALRQKIRNSLSLWLGEWFLDIDAGVNYQLALSSTLSNNLVPDMINIVSQIPLVDKILYITQQPLTSQGVIAIDMKVMALKEVLSIQFDTNVIIGRAKT
jgi:hypothetical protein